MWNNQYYQLFSICNKCKVSSSIMFFTNIFIFLTSNETVSRTSGTSRVVLHIDSNAWILNFFRRILWTNLTRVSAFSESRSYDTDINDHISHIKTQHIYRSITHQWHVKSAGHPLYLCCCHLSHRDSVSE